MARGKPQQMEMIAEINFNLRYSIQTNMITRQDKEPTSSRSSMKSTVEHLNQRNTPKTRPQQLINASIW